MVQGRRAGSGTFEHFATLLLENARAALEFLALEELGDGYGFGLGRAGLDGDLLLLLLRRRGALWRRLAFGGIVRLLLLCSLLRHHLGAHFLGELLGREALLCRFGGELLLDGLDLLWGGLLAGLQRRDERGCTSRHGEGAMGFGSLSGFWLLERRIEKGRVLGT